MDDDARRAAVAALIDLAASSDSQDRVDAGRALAQFAEIFDARRALLALVLDAGDTYVTRVTAEALLRRQDKAGLTVVASALAVADCNHADYIHTAVLDVFVVFGRDCDAAVRVCEALTRDQDDHVRVGATQLIGALAEIKPVLLWE